MQTEMIDKLYLELSQFTKAKTRREMELESLIARLCETGERLADHWLASCLDRIRGVFTMGLACSNRNRARRSR